MEGINISKKQVLFLLVWGLILEFPVRYFVSPDPWIHNPNHWYFLQPGRLFTEIGFVLLAFLPFLLIKDLHALIFKNITRKKIIFLVVALPIGAILFSVTEWEDILQIKENNLLQYVPLWFVTGFFIGVGQEFTFRGLIYTGVNKMAGMKWAIVISTICFVFGSIHSPRMYAYFMNGYVSETILLFVVFTLAGLFFTWVRRRTDNVMIPAMIHGIGNAITWSAFVVLKLYL